MAIISTPTQRFERFGSAGEFIYPPPKSRKPTRVRPRKPRQRANLPRRASLRKQRKNPRKRLLHRNRNRLKRRPKPELPRPLKKRFPIRKPAMKRKTRKKNRPGSCKKLERREHRSMIADH